MSELPVGPWQDLSADFCGPLPSGEYLLVITDEYSRYPIVEIVPSVSSNKVIPVIDKVLSEMGVPRTIKTDNGSPFNSDAFRKFVRYCGFNHRKMTPRWPRANSQAESFNKSVKTSYLEAKNWRKEMFRFLRQYRSTPHTSTGYTPFRLLFQREPRTRLPDIGTSKPETKIDEQIRQNDARAKAKMKSNFEQKHNIREEELQPGDKI
ncbi:uncharacterized protein K02A2.6-like [Ruditapes philippinarum]|uniref:uncharacterized protein K02A2.6-like n=1 Tax=Ruditapes philippinarum TaxID=129788 RepID=UPI00295BC400|nr:uncharacterized protein K02A2.6-like [Ruditapes philippinarum]